MAKVTGKLFHDHFGKKIFWEEKYAANSELFEWYHSYKMIKDVVTQYIKDIPAARVLNVGCGTSKLPEDMYNEGFRNIVNIDSSQDCIDTMRAYFNETMPKTFLYMKMDLLEMNFGDNIFTHVVDKGTFDSIASGNRSTENLHKYLTEINRVMTKQGIYFCLSHRDLDDRSQFFDRFNWNVAVHKVYRPEFNTELRFIKQQYISKKVIEGIEREKEIEVNPEDMEKEPADQELIAELLEEEKVRKQEREEAIKALKPRDVLCFYLYVCCKGEPESEKQKIEETNLISAEGDGFLNDSQIETNKQKQQASKEGEEEGGYEQGDEEQNNPSMSEIMD